MNTLTKRPRPGECLAPLLCSRLSAFCVGHLYARHSLLQRRLKALAFLTRSESAVTSQKLQVTFLRLTPLSEKKIFLSALIQPFGSQILYVFIPLWLPLPSPIRFHTLCLRMSGMVLYMVFGPIFHIHIRHMLCMSIHIRACPACLFIFFIHIRACLACLFISSLYHDVDYILGLCMLHILISS